MSKLFELAVRKKYRFPFRGQISVEDLWDLSITNLDAVFKTLNKEKKQSEEESLLSVKSEADKEVENKIEIVKYIVAVKQAEAAERISAKEKAQRKQKIAAIIERKQDEELESKSIEELMKIIED